MKLAITGALLVLYAGAAEAKDWRAIPLGEAGHDVGFVDADSVERQDDARISFIARYVLAENASNSDFPYDQIEVAATGRCESSPDTVPLMRFERMYQRRGRTVTVPAWRDKELASQVGWMADQLCRGQIGYRSFPNLTVAMTEYAEHQSSDQLAAYVSDEVSLTGRVVQGFEANYIALCGSETGCTDGAQVEACWLNGNISVPVPAGARDWVDGGPRRDAADFTFTGRIARSRSGRGFGHMKGWGCQVEQTGPAQRARITQKLAVETDWIEAGKLPDAVTAHAAMDAGLTGVAPISVSQRGLRWTIGGLKSGAADNGGACLSYLIGGEAAPEANRKTIDWYRTRAVTVDARTVTIRTGRFEEHLTFHVSTPAAARALASAIEGTSGRGVEGVEQRGREVVLHFAGGRRHRQTYASAADAIEAAAIAEALRGKDITFVPVSANTVTPLVTEATEITFADMATAERTGRLMQELNRACTAAPAASRANASDAGEAGESARDVEMRNTRPEPARQPTPGHSEYLEPCSDGSRVRVGENCPPRRPYTVPDAWDAQDQPSSASAVHQCAQPVEVSASLRSFRNVCSFAISVAYCAASSNCRGGLTHLYLPPGFVPAAAFRDKAEWIACRHPARPHEARYVEGRGVIGTCVTPAAETE